jgi:hypothetical protein
MFHIEKKEKEEKRDAEHKRGGSRNEVNPSEGSDYIGDEGDKGRGGGYDKAGVAFKIPEKVNAYTDCDREAYRVGNGGVYVKQNAAGRQGVDIRGIDQMVQGICYKGGNVKRGDDEYKAHAFFKARTRVNPHEVQDKPKQGKGEQTHEDHTDGLKDYKIAPAPGERDKSAKKCPQENNDAQHEKARHLPVSGVAKPDEGDNIQNTAP